VVSVCLEEEAGHSNGQVYSNHKVIQPSEAAQDAAKAAECWRISCEATGLPLAMYGGLPVHQQ
jgi:hypothetical protein